MKMKKISVWHLHLSDQGLTIYKKTSDLQSFCCLHSVLAAVFSNCFFNKDKDKTYWDCQWFFTDPISGKALTMSVKIA